MTLIQKTLFALASLLTLSAGFSPPTEARNSFEEQKIISQIVADLNQGGETGRECGHCCNKDCRRACSPS